MYWRRLQHVFSVTVLRLPRRLEDVLKTTWKTKKCYDEDVLKTCLGDVLKTCLEDVLKTSWKHVFKMFWRHILKTSWRHYGEKQNTYCGYLYLTNSKLVVIRKEWELRSNAIDALLLKSKSMMKIVQHFLKSLLTYDHRSNNEMSTIKLIYWLITLVIQQSLFEQSLTDSLLNNDFQWNLKKYKGEQGSKSRTNYERKWKLSDPIRYCDRSNC